MPRKKSPVTVTVAGETWELSPLAGTKSFIVVPRIIGLASEVIFAAGRANIELKTLITEDGFDFSAITAENFLAFKYIAELLAKEWSAISKDILPVLLGADPAWLEENGSPFELMAAIGTSLNFNAPYIFGDKMWVGLKKLLVAESSEEIQEGGPSETD